MVQVLRQLPKPSHPDLLVGHEHFDDAGVYRLDSHTALVQTLDFFPPLVDDPYTFGRIAATNALSDVYAMGGEPMTAMNIVGFPDKDLPMEILGDILRGGAERVAAAGAVIVGGHSVRDAEVKYGLSVTGRVHPDRIITNAGARPGDKLVLTKPIGSGTLTSAAKADKIGEPDLAEAIDVMTELNKAARNAMVAAGAIGATDITGFGLVGHAFELADASRVGIRIEAHSVPLMQRAREFAEQGILTRAHKGTIAYLGDRLRVTNIDDALKGLLCDAQTSGGMLICIPADQLDALMQQIDACGVRWSAIIGDVVESDAPFIELF
ncbi:MAG: selenide, water dikinase SelD [Phycisphaerales bacterium]|nr:selenide, water dikinase SelD [Phycisphaerales bacterium]MCB9856221.1 selenide, water dikinase SelD [Phycisphaerales bacterium]MCB9863340.1 selenide, water dikinase SelD [Phycisphaerales bacterium]